MTSDPVFVADGDGLDGLIAGWYFWNETWSECYGPYETETEAREALRAYAKEL